MGDEQWEEDGGTWDGEWGNEGWDEENGEWDDPGAASGSDTGGIDARGSNASGERTFEAWVWEDPSYELPVRHAQDSFGGTRDPNDESPLCAHNTMLTNYFYPGRAKTCCWAGALAHFVYKWRRALPVRVGTDHLT
jgi:hypothetical protein